MVFSKDPEKPRKPIEMEQLTDPEVVRELTESLERFTRNHEYIEKNWKELLTKYPNNWIVVKDEIIVGIGKTLTVFDEVRAKGIDLADAAHAYLDPSPRPLILTAVSS